MGYHECMEPVISIPAYCQKRIQKYPDLVLMLTNQDVALIFQRWRVMPGAGISVPVGLF